MKRLFIFVVMFSMFFVGNANAINMYVNTSSSSVTLTTKDGVNVTFPVNIAVHTIYKFTDTRLIYVGDDGAVNDANNLSISGSVKMNVGTIYTPGKLLKINVPSGNAGTAKILLPDASTTVIILNSGTTVMPLAAKGILSNSASGAAFEIWK